MLEPKYCLTVYVCYFEFSFFSVRLNICFSIHYYFKNTRLFVDNINFCFIFFYRRVVTINVDKDYYMFYLMTIHSHPKTRSNDMI